MDIYKNFVQQLRRKEFEDVYIVLSEDVTQKLKEYVLLLLDVKFVDEHCHTYYGDLKKIIASFIVYFSAVIDDVVKNTDKYTNVINKADLQFLMDRTITIQQENQVEFSKHFLPTKTSEEEQIYDEIQREYDEHMEKLTNFKKDVIDKLIKDDDILDFAKQHFKIAVIKMSEILNFTDIYMGMMLADWIPKIRISLEEICKRMSNNLTKIQEDHDAAVDKLLNKLYDKNKEKHEITRIFNVQKRHSLELAEVDRGIENVTTKLENLEAEIPLSRLRNEVVYWKKRTDEFYEVAGNLTRLKAAKDEVIKEENMYSSLELKDLTRRKEHITELIMEAAQTLITFFAVRGTDRILYTDNVGTYYLDEFNHQVYVFDHGLGIYHINCDGDFKEIPEEAYFFDKFGRYIEIDGERTYQCAPCTSHYKLVEDNLLKKITKDCGHSDILNNTCKTLVKDHTKIEMLPDLDPVDIRRTLDKETVQYLWDSFGGLLPEALRDVAVARPRNPIHFLAHKLIYHKYRRTAAELQQVKKEAEIYQKEVLKNRMEKAAAASKKWKSKQVKRRKPEESDDSESRAVYDAKVAEQMFINSINYFYM